MILKKAFAAVAMATVVLIAGCNKDNDPTPLIPQALTSTPADEAVDVETNSAITITFNKDMDPATIGSSTFTVMKGTDAVAGTITYADSIATFTPTNDLTASTVFAVALTTDAQDMDGLPLESDYTFSFTTGLAPDTTAPVVTLTDPLNNVLDVPVNQVISVTFSEAMDASTVNTTSILLASGTTVVSGAISYNRHGSDFHSCCQSARGSCLHCHRDRGREGP